ncbi:hypothetical protein EVAR_78796_1 [Eumeta japonica]|uniref:Uncharacterized protein n=1 Tax=Eumeta variegata TaxID=151549 RepID=A0A4C1T4Y9_EUMVA|nr:hypothetical protein EVAR_78796_1 [Eumeta japonica]
MAWKEGDSARAESPRDFLCRDAHFAASIGQSRADGIPCRSAATDEVLKAPIYYRTTANQQFASGVFSSVKVGHTPRMRVRGSSLGFLSPSARKERSKKKIMSVIRSLQLIQVVRNV